MPGIGLQIEIRCRGFDLRIVLVLIERGELVDRIGVQTLSFDPGIASALGL